MLPDEIVSGQKVARVKVARAKELRRGMTTTEGRLWRELRDGKLGAHFRRQQVIASYIVDFYCHTAALVVEVDGPIHASRGQEDAKRDAALVALRLRTLRFTNGQVLEDLPGVLKSIAVAIKRCK